MKMRFVIILSFISFVSIAQNTDDILNNAIKERDSQNYNKAIMLLDKGLEMDSNNVHLLIEKSRCYSLLYQYSPALTAINKAIEKNPTYYDSYYFRSVIDFYLGNIDTSLIDINKAINESKKAKYSNYYTWRGSLYIQLKDNDKAEQDLLTSLEIDPDNQSTLDSYACLLMANKKFTDAKIKLECLFKKNPDNIRTISNLAYVNIELHNYAEAISLCDKGINLNSKDNFFVSLFYNNKGYANYFLTNYDEALKNINKAIEVNPKNSYAFKNRALVYIKLSNSISACTDIQKAIELDYVKLYGSDILDLKNDNCKK